MGPLKRLLRAARPGIVDPGDQPPFPAVVGVGRSGTTLLRLMLDAHPQLAVPPETPWLQHAAALAARRAKVDELRTALTGNPSWGDMGIGDAELDSLLASHDQVSADLVRAVFRHYAEVQGKPRWGEKTPGHVRTMTELARTLPELHFIHVIRDGRDVALSYSEVWFGPGKDPRDAATFWRDRIVNARTEAKALPHYMEVRYEELVRDPEAVLREIGEFIGLPFHPDQMQAHLRAEERLSELGDKIVGRGGESHHIRGEERRHIHRLTMQPPDPSRSGRWRTEMSPEAIAAFEAEAGDLLEELGYPRGAD